MFLPNINTFQKRLKVSLASSIPKKDALTRRPTQNIKTLHWRSLTKKPTTGWTLELPLFNGNPSGDPPKATFPPRNSRGPLWSGLMKTHWFPLIRPKITPLFLGGAPLWGGAAIGFPWLFLGPFLWGFSVSHTTSPANQNRPAMKKNMPHSKTYEKILCTKNMFKYTCYSYYIQSLQTTFL